MAKSKATFHKKELENKRRKDKQEKLEKKAERKARGTSSFNDMIAYIDENGNITDQPQDIQNRKVYTLEEVPDAVAKNEGNAAEEGPRTGAVDYFNTSKGFGFIRDAFGDRVFVHKDYCDFPIREGDKVTFETQMGDRGPLAVNVKKVG
jgi:cold shock CspA family protein